MEDHVLIYTMYTDSHSKSFIYYVPFTIFDKIGPLGVKNRTGSRHYTEQGIGWMCRANHANNPSLRWDLNECFVLEELYSPLLVQDNLQQIPFRNYLLGVIVGARHSQGKFVRLLISSVFLVSNKTSTSRSIPVPPFIYMIFCHKYGENNTH